MSNSIDFFSAHEIDLEHKRKMLTVFYAKSKKMTNEQVVILADIISFFVRNKLPDSQIERLAEKYQQPVNSIRDKVGSIFKVFKDINDVGEEETSIDQDIEVLSYISKAKFPAANRWQLAEFLNVSAQTGSNIIARLLDHNVLKVVDFGGVCQLALTTDRDRLIEYAKSKSGFSKRYLNKFHQLLNNQDKSRQIESHKNENDVDLAVIIKNLSPRRRLMMTHHLRVLLVDEALSVPKSAPDCYKNVEESGNIIDFLNRTYGQYMDGILFGRKELSNIDIRAAKALGNYEARHGKIPLKHLNLPTITQKNEALVSSLSVRQMIAAHSIMNTKKRREVRDAFI